MRKKLSSVLIVVLCVILVCTLVACTHTPINKDDLPNEVPEGGSGGTGKYALRVSSSKHINSVFSGVEINGFTIEDFDWYLLTLNDAGSIVDERNMGSVTENMVNEADRALLQKAGAHNIRIKATLDDGTQVSGSFVLHLKSSSKRDLINVKFKSTPRDNTSARNPIPNGKLRLDGSSEVGDCLSIAVEAGAEFMNWDEFVSAFKLSVIPERAENFEHPYALVALGYGNPLHLFTDGTGWPLKLTDGMEIFTYWSQDTVKVTFDLNMPVNAPFVQTETYKNSPAEELRTSKLNEQVASRGSGKVQRPPVDMVNRYSGKQLMGWFVKATDKRFNFNEPVGNSDIELEARWTDRNYSYTMYLKGGDFLETIEPTMSPVESAEDAASKGLKVIDCTTVFGITTNELSRIVFSGFEYGDDYSKCVAEVQVNPDGDKKWLKFSDFANASNAGKLLGKGDGTLLIDKFCTDYQCTIENTLGETVEGDSVVYVRWKFNAPSVGEDYDSVYLERISKYITEVAFKNGVAIKDDGSVSLRNISDPYVNELVIPAEITYEGQTRKVSEIADGACMNLKALTTLDMSGASNLTRIGSKAFNYCRELVAVTMPAINIISSVGAQAFATTKFEDNYVDGDLPFLVINGMLYKYTGKEENGSEIDLTGLTERDDKVTSILEGAFVDSDWITKITLSKDIERIERGAFSGLTKLKEVFVPEENALKYVGEGAFENSGLLYASDDNKNYDASHKSVIIGSVYYRFRDNPDVTSAIIPDTIKYIAEGAFKGFPSLDTVTFDAEENLLGIGKDAFIDNPKLLGKAGNNGFTTFNGILSAYYGNRSDLDVVIPSEVKIISEHAFSSYAINIRTVELHSALESVEDYAFYGTNNLQSVILSAADVADDKLSGAPLITLKSFVDSKTDAVFANLRFFVREAVYNLLDEISTGSKTTSDKATQVWVELFRLHKEKFVVEQLSGVRVDENKVPTVLLAKSDNAFQDAFGDSTIEDALIVESNTGITRRASLNMTDNSIKMIKVTPDGDYSEFYVQDPDITRYVLQFEYQGETYPKGNENIFVVSVCDDIKQSGDQPVKFYRLYVSGYEDRHNPSQRIDASTRLGDIGGVNMWFEGLEDEIEGSDIAYWTNDKDFEPVFKYRDYNGKVHEIGKENMTIKNLYRSAASNGRTADIEVKFHGIGVLHFILAYSVRDPKYYMLQQTGPISLPLNATASQYFIQHNYTLRLVSENGEVTDKLFSRSNYNYGELETTVLGMHTISVNYNATDSNGLLSTTVYYTVVLEGDESQFTFETTDRQISDAEGNKLFDGEATITACNARYAATIVIPGTYHKTVTQNGEPVEKVYKVTRLGQVQGTRGVFENFKSLKSVYLSSNLEFIGAGSFAGCDALANVFTAQESTAKDAELTMDNLDEISEEPVQTERGEIYLAKLANLTGVKCEAVKGENGQADRFVLPIGSEYEIDGKTYRIVAISDSLTIDDDQISDGSKGIYVYLPDSVYRFDADRVDIIPPQGNVVEINYYSSDSPRFRVFERTNITLKYVGARAFEGCVSLKTIDFSGSQDLYYLGGNMFENSGIESILLCTNTKLTEIGPNTFAACSNLKTISIHPGIISIGEGAFANCYSLSEILVHDGPDMTEHEDKGLIALTKLVNIDSNAFANCRSLTEFTLNKSVKFIGNGAFSSCSALTLKLTFDQTEIPEGWDGAWAGEGSPIVYNCNSNDVASDKLIYIVDNGVRYALNSADYTARVVAQPYATAKDIVIPDSVSYKTRQYTITDIAENAFAGNITIETVTVSGSLKTIGRYAFRGCHSLQLFKFSGENNLTNVNGTAFEDCPKLVAKPQVSTKSGD